MAERNPPAGRKRTASPRAAAGEESKAQAEFARYKQRVESADEGSGAGAGFGTPLPRGAMPVWSLRPPAASGGWSSPAPPPGGGSQSIVQGFGTTIRLGVDFLNAALSSGVVALSGVGDTVRAAAWGESSGCGCDDCCGCESCAVDCCCVVGCGCGSCGGCEPSVGTCC